MNVAMSISFSRLPTLEIGPGIVLRCLSLYDTSDRCCQAPQLPRGRHTQLKVVYRAIWSSSELSTRGQDEICEVVHQHVMTLWTRAGWSLTPIEGAHIRNGEEPLSSPAEW